jgi:hypothetical protein
MCNIVRTWASIVYTSSSPPSALNTLFINYYFSTLEDRSERAKANGLYVVVPMADGGEVIIILASQ